MPSHEEKGGRATGWNRGEEMGEISWYGRRGAQQTGGRGTHLVQHDGALGDAAEVSRASILVLGRL